MAQVQKTIFEFEVKYSTGKSFIAIAESLHEALFITNTQFIITNPGVAPVITEIYNRTLGHVIPYMNQ